MNKERILQLADVIEKTPHRPLDRTGAEEAQPLTGFNMGEFHCGTVGCIAGWAAHLFGGSFVDAEKHLGISEVMGDDLFLPDGQHDQITPSKAAAVLRHLAETGKVDWSITP